MKLHLPAVMLCMLLATSAQAASPIRVEARGSVRHPGMHTLPADARLSAAALAARPNGNAYMLGAALLREQAIPAQSRLKVGLLFDLELLAAQPKVADAASRMRDAFQRMPVTGRVPQMLDPRPLEATPTQDTPARSWEPHALRRAHASTRTWPAPFLQLHASLATLLENPAALRQGHLRQPYNKSTASRHVPHKSCDTKFRSEWSN
ncbi:hypothetical protein D3C71_1044230 [compost metagenome]